MASGTLCRLNKSGFGKTGSTVWNILPECVAWSLVSHILQLLRDTVAVQCFLRVIIVLLNATVKNPVGQSMIPIMCHAQL